MFRNQGTIEHLCQIIRFFFDKDFVGLYKGSVSMRLDFSRFMINKRDAIFANPEADDFIQLYTHEDNRYTEASRDAKIHSSIYNLTEDAKYIAILHPIYAVVQSLENELIKPVDPIGQHAFGQLPVYNPSQFDDFYENADIYIKRYFAENDQQCLLVKGYGLCIYGRDIIKLVRFVEIFEFSCKVLMLHQKTK